MLITIKDDRPLFRNPDKLQVLPHREWVRRHKPRGREGYVVEDLDLVLRVYGKQYCADQVGRFMLLELKYGMATMDFAQRKTFGVLDSLLQKADPSGRRYAGHFQVNYTNEDWDVAEFTVNGLKLERDKWIRFLDLDDAILQFVRDNGSSLLIHPT